MSWTEDRVNLLKKLWGEGKTAAEIAKELGGVTRNAVIGKAHRLKLSNRVSPIQQNKKPAPAAKAVGAKKKPSLPASANDTSAAKYTLLELKGSMCRWPSGDPQEDGFGFCGETSVPGLHYCHNHAQTAYQAAARNRLLKAEDFEDKPKSGDQEEEDSFKEAIAG